MTTADITDLPASAFAGCRALLNVPGYLVSRCGSYMNGRTSLCPECMAKAAPPDTTLVKSSRHATCAVCREVVTGSIELPTGEHVCGRCVCIALRNMIDDAAACRGDR